MQNLPKNKFSRRNLHDSKGFTLIETMIAIGIIAVGLFALMTIVAIILKGNMQSKNVTEATTLAQDKIEEMKNVDYLNLPTYNGTYTVYSENDSLYKDYYLYVTVDSDVPATDSSTVTVDVYYNPGTPTSSHKVQLQTIISE